jgi:hypothetical protein
MIHHGRSISEQIQQGRQFAQKRYGANLFIAYFQSFTNTYAAVPKLKSLYDEALRHPGMVGLSVATRPDCVDPERLELLHSYQEKYLVWVEYGLQSAHDVTLSRINRGHDAACFERAVRLSARYGLNVCAHIILGLPGETPDMMLATARYLADLPVQGVKIHLLYVVEDTPLAVLHRKGAYTCLNRDEYIGLVIAVLERLPPSMVIHRLTGDPISSELVAPAWARDKTANLNRIRKALEAKDTWQGKRYRLSTAG